MARLEDHPIPQRIYHGINLVSFTVLAVSGYYMYRPFAPGLMGTMKTLHYVFMFVITANLFARVYYAFYGRHRDAGVFAVRRSDLQALGPMVRYYLFLGTRPRTDRLNPLQKLGYQATIVTIAVQALTGFAMHWPDGTLGFAVKLAGGLHNLRLIHIFLMWLFFVGVLIHLYMVFTEAYDEFLLMCLGKVRPTAGAERGEVGRGA